MPKSGCKDFLINAALLLLLLLLICLLGTLAYAGANSGEQKGLSLGTMRLVYPGDRRAIPLTLTNNTDQTWLAQSSVKAVDFVTGDVDRGAAPFIVTPPLVRLRPGDKMLVRIMSDGHVLPADRESVFWVSVRMIPRLAEDAGQHGQLSVGVVQNIKLFYRPQGLATSGMVKVASEKIQASRVGQYLVLKNGTPVYITTGKLTVNGVTVAEMERHRMIPPRGEQRYTLPANIATAKNGITVSWQAVDEHGELTSVQQRQIR